MSKSFPKSSQGFHPFGELLGLEFSQCEKGSSSCQLEISQKLMNPHGVVHGGVMYSMADTGMGGALYTALEANELCATVEIKIHYFKAVSLGTVHCQSKIINHGKRIAVLESELFCNDFLVAKALGTFSIFTPQR